MKQLVGRVLGLVLLGVVIAIGGIWIDTDGADVTDSATITDYRADFTVDEDGDLKAVETLRVNFPPGKHGIFRIFDQRDPNHDRNRLIPTDIRVARDNQNEPYEVQDKQRGRLKVLKIGSADVTLSGDHTYQIGYEIQGVLTEGTNGSRTMFYWNLVPQAWQMPSEKATLTVSLPAEAENLRCVVGLGSGVPCEVEGAGTDRLTITTGRLEPNTPVTLQAGLDIPTPDGDTLPWPSWLDPVLGRSTGLLGTVLGIALVVGALGYALSRSTYEKKPGFPLMYAPPDGIGPAQAAYILTEDVDEKQGFVATMMYAAERGVVSLDLDGKTWKVTGRGDPGMWQALDGVTHTAGQSLGVIGSGQTFAASPTSASSGQELKTALSKFEADTKGWAKTSGLMVSSGLGGGGCLVLIAVLALTVFLGAWNPWNMSILAIIPGFFGLGALAVGATGAGTKRTPAGRDLWSRVGGFHRVLSTPSAKERFDFAARKDLYTSYLPWAVAFDCADEWAKKYRLETGQEPPTPSWFPTYTGAHTAAYVNQMVDSFDSAVSSAISAYDATQSSSSGGGGGGFSGGGGGGGGGGGSW